MRCEQHLAGQVRPRTRPYSQHPARASLSPDGGELQKSADVGGFDPEIRGFEDWELWLHALAKGWHGVRVPAVTILYRRQDDATNFTSARREYRRWYGVIRAKHADLYARRSELARESKLGILGRGVYRFYWGPRPVPKVVGHHVERLDL